MTANCLRLPPRRANAAKLGRNSRRGEFFLDARMLHVESPVTQGTHRGSDGASLKSVSDFSHDPIGYGAGDENLYRYCGNDPLNASDPTGNERWAINTMTITISAFFEGQPRLFMPGGYTPGDLAKVQAAMWKFWHEFKGKVPRTVKIITREDCPKGMKPGKADWDKTWSSGETSGNR
jgi:hypothetical protein